MDLSYELISQFAKLATEDKKTNTESTVYGTVVVDEHGDKYVKLDGSDQLTPLTDASADVNENERVSVLIKNHTATVTGNISSPAARTGDVQILGDQIDEVKQFDIVLAEQVNAQEGYIEELRSDKATIGELQAATARIEELEATSITVEELDAVRGEIDDLIADKIDADVVDAEFVNVNGRLDAVDADIDNLNADYVEIDQKLTAAEASIKDLDTKKLSAEAADIKYANINFGNITEAAIKKIFSETGLIKDLIVGDGTITGELVGVTIKGDLIEGNTVKADKLVVKGSDGLYYKLNFEGGTFSEGEQVPTDSLHGSVITAKSITAEKVSVKDLVAFGATIGGFHITNSSIYSGVKSSVDNTTRGIYQDTDGQMAIGDGVNFLKYYRDQNGVYKLVISADSIMLGTGKKSVEESLGETVKTPVITGNGSQAVKIDNALRDNISGIKLYGKTTQFTTTGKNLLDPTACYANAGTTTLNGDVLTTEFTNGSIHVRNDTVFPAGTYTFSVVPITSDVQFAVYLYKASAYGTFVGSSDALNWAGGVTWTFTASEDFTFNLAGNYQIPGTYSYKLQLEEGSTVTAYEPYTGGIPSPNPDYPQDLESIGESKNLLTVYDCSDGDSTTASVCTVVDGVITRKANTSLESSVLLHSSLSTNIYTDPITPGTYVFSVDYIEHGGVWPVGSAIYAPPKAYATMTLNDGTTVNLNDGVATTITQPGKITAIRATTTGWEPGGFVSFHVQLERGDKATPYQSPRQGSIDAIVRYSNNLLDLNSVSFVNCTNNNGTLTSNLNDSYMAYMVVGYSDIMNILLANKGKPFTFSIKEAIEGRQLAIVIHGTRTNGATYQEVSWAGRYVTIDVAEDFETITAMELRWNRGGLITDTTTTCSDVQFEMGDIPTPYKPYKPPTTLTVSTPDGLPGIPVPSDGNYTDSTGQQWICDEVDLGRGVYVKRTGVIDLDGITYGKIMTGTDPQATGSKFVYAYKRIDDMQNDGTAPALSNYGQWQDTSAECVLSTSTVLAISFTRERLGIASDADPNTIVTAVNRVISELSSGGAPFWVRYVLKEPIETPLSAEQIAAFSALTNDPGYVVVESEAEMEIELSDFATGSSVNKVSEALRAETEARMILDDTIRAEVRRTDQFGADLEGVLKRVTTIEQTEQSFDIRVKSIESDGVNKVATSEKGYTFDDEGLTIADSDSDLKTQITEDGMTVKTENYNLLDMTKVEELGSSDATAGTLTGAVITNEYIDIVRQGAYDYARIPISLIGGRTYTLWYQAEVYDRPADSTGHTAVRYGFDSQTSTQINAYADGTYYAVSTVTPTTDMEDYALVYANYGSGTPAKVRFKIMLIEGAYTLDTVPPFKKYNNSTLLTANSYGVDAKNLHATTYLIVGDTSRFEDWKKNNEVRTACFWIGGGN